MTLAPAPPALRLVDRRLVITDYVVRTARCPRVVSVTVTVGSRRSAFRSLRARTVDGRCTLSGTVTLAARDRRAKAIKVTVRGNGRTLASARVKR